MLLTLLILALMTMYNVLENENYKRPLRLIPGLEHEKKI